MNETRNNTELFERIPIPQAIRTLAVPTIIAHMITVIYNMADTFFIGRVNNPLMVAAVSLILPIYSLTFGISSIAGTGGGTLIARLLGAGREKEARSVSVFSIWFSLIASLLYSLAVFAFMTPLLKLLGSSDSTRDFARTYCMCVIVFGTAPTVLSMTLCNLLRNVGCSKQAGFGLSMGGILNIALDPLFMFVLLPRGNEIAGAGIATALSNLISCVYFIAVIRRLNNPVLSFSPKHLFPEKESLRSFFSVGVASAVGPLLFDINYIVLNRMMAAYGDTALAAIGIVFKIERMPNNLCNGLCLGMVPLVAYNYSSGNHKRMDEALRFTRRRGALIAAVCILLYEIFAHALIRFFIADAATVALGTRFLRIRALATLMMFLSFLYVYFFQGIGRGDYTLGLTALRWGGVNIPMVILLGTLFGMYGLTWAQLAGDCIVAAACELIYRRFRKKSTTTPHVKKGQMI